MAEDNLPPDAGDAGADDVPVIDNADTGADSGALDGDGGELAPPTFEDLASDMGWRPQEQWRGDPEKWKPAHEFIRSTVDVNTKLSSRLKGVEDTLHRVASTSAQLTERAVAEARQKVLTERQEAIEMGDVAGVNAADAKLRSLPEPEPLTPPETQDFQARNDWFGKDQEATAWAVNRAGELAKQGLGPARQLAIVEREAKGLFPELFPEAAPARTPAKPAPLTPPGNRGGKPTAKGFAALPADAQTAALEYEKRGICKRDEYAKLYFDEQEA